MGRLKLKMPSGSRDTTPGFLSGAINRIIDHAGQGHVIQFEHSADPEFADVEVRCACASRDCVFMSGTSHIIEGIRVILIEEGFSVEVIHASKS
jgi:hypothetical protein